MFLINIHYTAPIDVIDKILSAHRDFLEQAYKKNLLLVSGPKKPRTGGVILCFLNNRTAVEELFSQDPFFLSNSATYEFIEFDAVKFHPNIAELMNK